MPASNLAIVLSPSVMPFQEQRNGKLTNPAQQHDFNIKTLEVIFTDFHFSISISICFISLLTGQYIIIGMMR